MYYPLLPLRIDGKLLFPIGLFSGWYSHVELRKAEELGYEILKIHKTYWFKENCNPFSNYVKDLFKLKKEYSKENNPMLKPVKLALNGLYGKTAQKFWGRDNIVPVDQLSAKEIWSYDTFEIIKDTNFARISEMESKPANFCFPEWASTITAHGRITMQNILRQSKAWYTDTDSTFSPVKYPIRYGLGDLSHEHTLEEFNGIKAKMYYKKPAGKHGYSVIKGLPLRLNRNETFKLLRYPVKNYKKIIKFKEALRRKLIPNQMIWASKKFDLEDNKRQWFDKYRYDDLQISQPLVVVDNIILDLNKDNYDRLVYSEKLQQRLSKMDKFQ